MSDPFVREIGRVEGIDSMILVGVDYDAVSLTVSGMEVRLSSAGQERLAQLFVAACWQAGTAAWHKEIGHA